MAKRSHTYEPRTPYPWVLVRDGRIVGYAWKRETAQATVSSYACAREWKGATVVPNPCVSTGAALAPRRTA
jgi:hypothetical protein